MLRGFNLSWCFGFSHKQVLQNKRDTTATLISLYPNSMETENLTVILHRNRQLSVECKSVQFLTEDRHSLEKPPERDNNIGLSGVIQTSSKFPPS